MIDVGCLDAGPISARNADVSRSDQVVGGTWLDLSIIRSPLWDEQTDISSNGGDVVSDEKVREWFGCGNFAGGFKLQLLSVPAQGYPLGQLSYARGQFTTTISASMTSLNSQTG